MPEPVVRQEVYRTYWTFAAERHRIFEARLIGAKAPWTGDAILGSYRFCNAFRAADRVTQHLIQKAAFGDPEADADDLFLRIVLHRLFSRPSTWALLEDELDSVDASSFESEKYATILDDAVERGARLYTGAFILCATPAFGFHRKHRNHLALLKAMLADGVPDRISRARSLGAVYCELRQWPLIGPFMAYQLAVDLNYSPITEFSEDDFVVPGPGALRGLAKVFVDLNGLTAEEAIGWLVAEQQSVEDRFGFPPPALFGRPLHAIDCQNLLCEVDKYCREAFPQLASNRIRIKQRLVADPEPLKLFFPPAWGINENVPEGSRSHVGNPAPV